MGFSAPKPDPKIAAEQAASAAQAKTQKISVLRQQLSNEDQVRARLYGAGPGNPIYSNFGTAPNGSSPVGIRGIFGPLFSGQL